MNLNSFEKTIEALTLISEAITSDQFIEEVLRLIVIVTAEAMNSKVCSLWLLDEKSQALTIRATQSINRDYLKERALKVGEGVVGLVAQERRPRQCLDVLTDQHFKEKELARKMSLTSMLSVPMIVKERVIGVINCYTSEPHEFTETEVNLLTTVANQAAVAIYNTELMVKSQVIREELEVRKLIERAKDVLIVKREMSGEEAFRWIQKRAMDSRKSMREVSEAVILAAEL
jgi:signal transduction protein with GAF and PtsI domain